MDERFYDPTWGQDSRGISDDPATLARLAALLEAPTPPGSTWRAATVALFATNPFGVVQAYLQHVQDLEWPVSEQSLLRQSMVLLAHRMRQAEPGGGSASPPGGSTR